MQLCKVGLCLFESNSPTIDRFGTCALKLCFIVFVAFNHLQSKSGPASTIFWGAVSVSVFFLFFFVVVGGGGVFNLKENQRHLFLDID